VRYAIIARSPNVIAPAVIARAPITSGRTPAAPVAAVIPAVSRAVRRTLPSTASVSARDRRSNSPHSHLSAPRLLIVRTPTNASASRAPSAAWRSHTRPSAAHTRAYARATSTIAITQSRPSPIASGQATHAIVANAAAAMITAPLIVTTTGPTRPRT